MSVPAFDFAGQVALVTGASGALGSVVARRLLAGGARLVLPDRQPEKLRAVFPEIDGGAVLAQACDVTDPDAVDALVQAAVERFGRIDILCNVAGGFRGGAPVHQSDIATWDFLMDLNARAVFLVCRAVVPVMLRAGGGRIANVASRGALAGDAGVAAYSASKAAVLRLTESLSAELKAQGIRVNAVLPGTIDTAANRAAMPGADTSRWVDPEALTDAILFLLSDAARAVHGAALPVYGLG
ncbi:MAG TPA: SDR family NAD(P)-dependent oxidoreductase [Thermoanaerobaculia bacterium]|nr:SDR family NAD(P)-dependent oxidoreductase [Thermoanaerobaculia bacterium]